MAVPERPAPRRLPGGAGRPVPALVHHTAIYSRADGIVDRRTRLAPPPSTSRSPSRTRGMNRSAPAHRAVAAALAAAAAGERAATPAA
jgi:hypothetical protein